MSSLGCSVALVVHQCLQSILHDVRVVVLKLFFNVLLVLVLCIHDTNPEVASRFSVGLFAS